MTKGESWVGHPAVVVCGIAVAFVLAVVLGEKSRGVREPVVHAASVSSPTMANPDAVCAKCHQRIYERYEKTPMAMGSGLALDGLDDAELSAKDLVHGASGVRYHVGVKGGKAYLDYDRAADFKGAAGAAGAGRGELKGEEQLEYFVGSGRRGRTFLYQQEGLWFEAPINWYGKKRLWDMAPAYEGATAMPAPLPVDPNCLHCHTGQTQMATGPVRNRYAGAPFLAAGVGCAACHGDGAAHVAGVNGKPGTGPIVNPNKLDAGRRDGACIQCHLEGDAAIYLPGKSLAAFKPGDDLNKSVIYFIDNSKAQLGRRASSQYEALLRSACKRASGDKLTCTTCHDPHGSPAPEERVAFFRTKCLACHTSEKMATHHPEQQDCASCHMPTRTTLDISHEQLTDHDVEARPSASSSDSGLVLTDLSNPTRARARELVPVGNVTAGDRELGLAYAELAQHGDRSSGERALKLLKAAEVAGSDDADLHDQLGYLLQVSGDKSGAVGEYLAALKQRPGDTTAAANLAVLDASVGQGSEAVRLLTQVVRDDPSQTAAGLNLAFLECRMGRKDDAAAVVRRMLVFNPDSAAARKMLEAGSYGGEVCALR